MDDNIQEEPNLLLFLGLDPHVLKMIIEQSVKLEDDKTFFEQLAAISSAKRIAEDALEQVEAYERDAKGLINAKAKALYGPDWQVIKGDGFKISRSYTGQIYEIADADKVPAEFIKTKPMPNAREIEKFREAHDNTLPEGISIRESRGESLRITVNE